MKNKNYLIFGTSICPTNGQRCQELFKEQTMENQICIYDENRVLKKNYMPRSKTQQKEGTFGHRLAEFRKAAGLTQEELAKALGTTRRMIAYYETEVDYQPAALFANLAKVLSLSADELLGLKENKVNGKKPPRRFLRRFSQIEQLSKRDQQALLRTVDGFLSSKVEQQ